MLRLTEWYTHCNKIKHNFYLLNDIALNHASNAILCCGSNLFTKVSYFTSLSFVSNIRVDISEKVLTGEYNYIRTEVSAKINRTKEFVVMISKLYLSTSKFTLKLIGRTMSLQ